MLRERKASMCFVMLIGNSISQSSGVSFLSDTALPDCRALPAQAKWKITKAKERERLPKLSKLKKSSFKADETCKNLLSVLKERSTLGRDGSFPRDVKSGLWGFCTLAHLPGALLGDSGGSGGGKGVGWGEEGPAAPGWPSVSVPSGRPRPPGRNFPRPAPARSPQGGLRTRDAAQVDLKGAGESSARPPRLSRRYSRLSQGHPLIQPGPSERAAGAHLRAAAGPRRGGSRGRRAGGIRGGRAAAPVRHAGGGTVGCGRATGDEARVPGSATTGASFIRAPPSGPRGAAERMAFPVDLLHNCTHEELENSAEDYLSNLRCADPENPECFSILNITIPISLSNVGFVPLYGGNQAQKILALFAPEDSLTAVALYLVDQWWAIDDIVRTSEPSREGLKQVSTLGERVVLYVLNRVIYRKQEMERNEIPFLCHSSTDYAKILWKKGEAVGFYSVKPTGSLCSSFLTQSYQLPVLDTMFIRKKYRGKDLGLHMLEDFVDSFTEEALGLRYPLSSLLYTASKQYFEKYPGDHELLWEVEGVGHWHQRIPVTRALQREAVKVAEISQYEAKRPVSAEYGLAAVREYEPGMEDSQSSEMQIHSLKDAFASTSEGPEKTPVSTRTRSSHLKRPKIGKRFQDSEFSSSQGEDENTAQTAPLASVNKIEYTARTSESSEEFLEEEPEQRVTEFEEESSDKDAQPALDTQPRLDKQDGDKDSTLEPVNGEVVDDALKTSLVTEEEDSSEGLEEELKVPSLNSSEETVKTVPVVADPPKTSEAAPDKTSPVSDSEMLTDQGPSDDKGHTEEKLVSKKKTHLGSSDNVATLSNEEKSDSGFPNSAVTDFPEEPVSENLSPNTTSSLEDQGEDGVLEAQETSAAQSSLIEVELEDVPFPQNAGQKNQSEEQSEASSEQLDQFTQSAEKAVDSSSEEIEVEVPVVDRRNLRRKAKGHKGPAKKKAKLS